MIQLEENLVTKYAAGSAAAATGTITGSGIDTAGYREALVILSIGTMAASSTLDVKIQHADADTGYGDFTGAAFAQKLAASHASKVFVGRLKLDGNDCKRWIKAVCVTGTDKVDYTVTIVLFGNQYNPQAVSVAEFTK